MKELIVRGRELLVESSGKDFGYDLMKWHDYLCANHEEYCLRDKRHAILGLIQKTIENPSWKKAISELSSKENRS